MFSATYLDASWPECPSNTPTPSMSLRPPRLMTIWIAVHAVRETGGMEGGCGVRKGITAVLGCAKQPLTFKADSSWGRINAL